MVSLLRSIVFASLAAIALLSNLLISSAVLRFPASRQQIGPGQANNVQEVSFTFTVVDKNKFAGTLKKEDIRLSEDGMLREIRNFQHRTDLPTTIAILIDTSASQEQVLPVAKLAARHFVETAVTDSDQVAVLTFTGKATIEQSFTNDRGRLRAAIDRVKF